MTESAMDEKLFTELKKFKVWGIVSWQKKTLLYEVTIIDMDSS